MTIRGRVEGWATGRRVPEWATLVGPPSAPRYHGPVRTWRPATVSLGVDVAAFVALVTLGILLTRPFDGPAGPDAAASVLFFDRIMAGRHLEVWVNTTPKPALTLVLGGLHALTGDWWAGAFASVLAFALGVVLSGVLLRRLVGPVGAVFAWVGLAGVQTLLYETASSYGTPWVLPLWMIAGLALVRPEPRYGVAGVAFLVAGLIRPETYILLGVATAMLAWQVVRREPVPRRAWLLMAGWLSIPGLALHDLLLTGDPLWWTRVARHSVELRDGRHRSVLGVLNLSWTVLASTPFLTVLAVSGGLTLLWQRRWIAVAGLVAMGPLVLVYVVGLAVLRLNVLRHYLDAADTALVLASAVAVAMLVKGALDRAAHRWPVAAGPPGMAVGIVLGAVLAVGLSRPYSPIVAAARGSIASEAVVAARLAAVEPTLASSVSRVDRAAGPDPGPMGAPDIAAIRLFAPPHRIMRLAVNLGLPLTAVAGAEPSLIAAGVDRLPVGSIVYIDGVVERVTVGPATAAIQVSSPTKVGAVRVVPILADPANTAWIVRIEAAP